MSDSLIDFLIKHNNFIKIFFGIQVGKPLAKTVRKRVDKQNLSQF